MTTLINQYEVIYSSNPFVPRIGLLNTGRYIGQLIFEPDGTVLPPDSLTGGQVNLFYHLEDFQNCLELLRNEQPIYLYYNGSGPGFENGIMTTPEPVGDAVKKAA